MLSDAEVKPLQNLSFDAPLASTEPTISSEAGVPIASVLKAFKMPKIISFNDLCRCGDEIWIEYDKQVYRLRKTKQGKLILTK